MSVFLFILSILAFFAGAVILADAKSAIHETEAFVFFLTSAVLLSGAGIIEAVKNATRKLEHSLKNLQAIATHTEQTARHAANIAATPFVSSSPPPPLGGRKPVEGQTYYYFDEGAQSGPHTMRDIKEFRDAGVLRDDTLVFKDGDSEWKPLRDFAEFRDERKT